MNRLPPEEEDEVARCRRVRDELDRRFGTLDAAFARLERLARLRKRRDVRTATARTDRAARPTARNGKPLHRKPVGLQGQ